MKRKLPSRTRRGFTLIELLTVMVILGVLTAIALPTYFNTVQASEQGTANANARALSAVVQAKAVSSGAYDATLADYARELGGVLPTNPCTGTPVGYILVVTGNSATVSAAPGTNCGSWTPQVFSLTF